MIRSCDIALRALWGARFLDLPAPAREALRCALLDLRCDALKRANVQWKRHKAPMAFYWKVVAVYSGHLARALRAPCKRDARAEDVVQVTQLRKMESPAAIRHVDIVPAASRDPREYQHAFDLKPNDPRASFAGPLHPDSC